MSGLALRKPLCDGVAVLDEGAKRAPFATPLISFLIQGAEMPGFAPTLATEDGPLTGNVLTRMHSRS